MKKITLLSLLTILSLHIVAQNLLSPIWKINTEYETLKNESSFDYSDWAEVNLLKSWEWQGYSWMDKQCRIVNDFVLDEGSSELQLEFSLQATIKNVYLNGKQIAGAIPNYFWTDRGKVSSFVLPEKLLNQEGKNIIWFDFDELSYTGGKSYNYIRVFNKKNKLSTKVELVFPVANHVFVDKKRPQLTLNTNSPEPGKAQLIIKDDFHTEYANLQLEIPAGESSQQLNLNKFELKPGFYEVTVMLYNGAYAGDIKWFAIEPEKITCEHQGIEEFDGYWQSALKELRTIDPKFRMHKVDSLCSEKRNGYVVEMQSIENLTIRGYYFVPKAKGSYPVVLHVPGYTYGFEHHDVFKNRNDNVAELAICVRGHGISKDVFDPWDEQTLWSVGACSKEENIYRAIYMDCVQAVNFLWTREEIDKNKIAVAGGSQGGGLSLATAALCNDKIAACVYYDPFLCDIKHQTKIRTIVQQEFVNHGKMKGNNCDAEQVYRVQEYNDTKNFADQIKCPVFFVAALFDDDCPVHCGFAAYNLITATKSYKVYPNDSHLGESGIYGSLYDEALKLLDVK